MAVFVVLPQEKSPDLEQRIRQAFADGDHYKVNDFQYLVSAEMTAKQVTEKIGILDDQNIPATAVFSVVNYFGRHASDLWEWLKLKMEKSG